MTGKDVYLQMTWSWPDKTWNILCSYCLQWNTSQSKFRNHYFLFYLLFPYGPNFFWFGVVLQTLDGGLKWVLSKSGIYSKSYLLSYVAWCYSVHEWSHNTCFRSCSMNGHLHMIGTPRSSRTTLHWKWMTSGLVYGIVDSRLETQWKRQYDEDRFHFKTPE